PKFMLQAVRGKLIVTCEVDNSDPLAECLLNMTGPEKYTNSAITAHHRFTLEDLLSGEYEVRAKAPGYKAKTQKAFISIGASQPLPLKLEVDEWEKITDLQLYDRVVYSLGGREALTAAATAQSTLRMTLNGDSSIDSLRAVQATEYLTRKPDRLRWD